MCAEILSSKIRQEIKENEEKKANERKKNLLYLIANYLKENGFHNTCEYFINEAQLQSNIEVCDNIDLDIILQEYINYYTVKFKKTPRLTRKVSVSLSQDIQPIKNQTRTQTPNSNMRPVSTKPKKSDTKTIDKISPFSVTPLLPSQNNRSESQQQESIGDNISVFRPLYDFSGFNSDWKELADIISKDIIDKDLNVQWNDIKGLDKAKNLLKEAVLYPLKFPDLFKKLPVPWKGILLYGPPGTGKTFLAKALASQCQNSTFFNMSASSLISKWRGESEKLVRVLFELAKYQAPSTVFIDEIDALGSKRDECQHEASRRFKSELLIQLDGISTTTDHVFLLATSNLPWDIDPAILRRFEKRILIDFPDVNARMGMFEHYLKEMSTTSNLKNSDYESFAKLTSGYTGSDIKMICKEASIIPIRHEIMNKNNIEKFQVKPLTVSDVLMAIELTKPSTKYLAEKYHKWDKEFGCN